LGSGQQESGYDNNRGVDLDPDPTTFQTCSVYPVAGPDLVLLSTATISELEKAKYTPRTFTAFPRPQLDYTGWGTGARGKAGNDNGVRTMDVTDGIMGGWDPTEFG